LHTFLQLLAQYRIEAVADVRRFPGSRRQPQYVQVPLYQALAEQGIAYHWIAALGSRRPLPDFPNIAWRNASFRGYADHIAGIAQGLNELIEAAGRMRTAMMCAETVWWRCHRSLIADVCVCVCVCARHPGDAYSRRETRRHASLHGAGTHRSGPTELRGRCGQTVGTAVARRDHRGHCPGVAGRNSSV